jgi:hypothetical protein
MSGYRVYQADPVEFDLDMTRSHSFKKVYTYVGASINLVISCDWAGAFDTVAATAEREPEGYRAALAPFYNDSGAKIENNYNDDGTAIDNATATTVNDRWGTILDSLIYGVMQLISSANGGNQDPQNLLNATFDNLETDFNAAANALNTVVNTVELDFAKVRASLAYTADAWVEVNDENKRNRLKETDGESNEGTANDIAPVDAATEFRQSDSVHKTNLGMLVNNTNVKQVLNAMAVDGCFKFSFTEAGKHMAPATMTEFNSLVRENLALSDNQRAQRIIDKNDKMIFPCDLKTLHYSTSSNDSPAWAASDASTAHVANTQSVTDSGMDSPEGKASSTLDEPKGLVEGSASSNQTADGSSDHTAVDDLDNAGDKSTGTAGGMYQLAIANQITYDVNIVFQQSKRTDGELGHDGMVLAEQQLGGDAQQTAQGDGPDGIPGELSNP